jgi:acetolactate synthase regulatory subunit
MAGASIANAPKLIQVEFTVDSLVSMKFLFIQFE